MQWGMPHCLFWLFAPFWSSLGNTRAVELRFGKPSADYQKLIFCAAAFMAARWSALTGGGARARQVPVAR